MKTFSTSSPFGVADYAARALRKIPADSIVAVGMISTRLGAVMRVDDAAPAEVLGALLAKSLQDSGHERAILIGYGSEDRAPRWLEVEAVMADRGMPLARLMVVDEKACTDLLTGKCEPYAPGTSDLGLTLALADGAPVQHRTATPVDTDELAPLIDAARERLGTSPRTSAS